MEDTDMQIDLFFLRSAQSRITSKEIVVIRKIREKKANKKKETWIFLTDRKNPEIKGS